jgi:glycosyltransferase involved in cell wall biosynthesis
MGRVAWHWRQELIRRGYEVVHIGQAEVGLGVHPAFFPWTAWQRSRELGLHPAFVLAHEPAGLPFVLSGGRRTFVFSHGLERRGWEENRAGRSAAGVAVGLRTRLLFPLWRLRQADVALRRARALLVLNRDDREFALRRYRRRPEDVFLFRNGVDPAAERQHPTDPPNTAGVPTVLFVGTWMARKGVRTLVEAAGVLDRRGIAPRFVLAGTGVAAEEILAAWPAELRDRVRVIPRFAREEEAALYSGADVFVLPSLSEGQPLALLQALAAGCCCVASDISGSRELITHRESGLLHPAGDAGGLAACLAECLASPGLRAELGQGARRAVAGRSWEVVARDVIDFVEGRL